MDRTVALGAIAVLGLAVTILLVVHDDAGSKRAPTKTEFAASTKLEEPQGLDEANSTAHPAGGRAAPNTVATTDQQMTDAGFTEKAREQLGKDPLLALKLARQGNQQFPSSPEAPERAWIIVKSLTDMGAFDDARAEARSMVDRYRNTRWTLDIERHVLSHPPGPPEPAPD